MAKLLLVILIAGCTAATPYNDARNKIESYRRLFIAAANREDLAGLALASPALDQLLASVHSGTCKARGPVLQSGIKPN
jgi:hypothetical protein